MRWIRTFVQKIGFQQFLQDFSSDTVHQMFGQYNNQWQYSEILELEKALEYTVFLQKYAWEFKKDSKNSWENSRENAIFRFEFHWDYGKNISSRGYTCGFETQIPEWRKHFKKFCEFFPYKKERLYMKFMNFIRKFGQNVW